MNFTDKTVEQQTTKINRALDEATKTLLKEHNLLDSIEYNQANVPAIREALEKKGFELVVNRRQTTKGEEVFIKLVRIVDQKKLLILRPTITITK